jgi:capsid protein
LGVESLTDITATNGKEWDEVIDQLARERRKINDLGLQFETPPITPGAPEEE